jgi:phosphoenolpyruvate synthase/pyruvate phosphate dikinase
MRAVRLTQNSSFTQEQLGGKGYNLQKLIGWDLNVPETYAISANETRRLDDGSEYFIELPNLMKSAEAVFAVRSSGIGEDGNENSFAGIFDTILDVKPSEINDAIREVYASKDTSVTSMYSNARNVKVAEMAIIIQKMVSADFAGVAFSVNPVEHDHKIGLIEIVKGLGESLVSGKVKPTSLRVNRITGIHCRNSK